MAVARMRRGGQLDGHGGRPVRVCHMADRFAAAIGQSFVTLRRGKWPTSLSPGSDTRASARWPERKTVYIDPLAPEPQVPRGRAGSRPRRRRRDHARPQRPRRAAPELAKQHSPDIVCMIECGVAPRVPGLREHPRDQQRRHGRPRRRRVTMTDALHSAGRSDGGYGGEAAGWSSSWRASDLPRGRHVRLRRHAADQPDLRAGRRDPPDRRLLHDGRARRRPSRSSSSNVKRCVPCHYGTFPALSGNPEELRELAPAGVEIIAPSRARPWTSDGERWFGATGRPGAGDRRGGRGRLPARRRARPRRRLGRRAACTRRTRGSPVVVRADDGRGRPGGPRAAGGRLRARPAGAARAASSSTSAG